MVPHLTTALTGPLLALERRFLERQTHIEHWLRGQWQEHSRRPSIRIGRSAQLRLQAGPG
jgi:hypothetical protein